MDSLSWIPRLGILVFDPLSWIPCLGSLVLDSLSWIPCLVLEEHLILVFSMTSCFISIFVFEIVSYFCFISVRVLFYLCLICVLFPFCTKSDSSVIQEFNCVRGDQRIGLQASQKRMRTRSWSIAWRSKGHPSFFPHSGTKLFTHVALFNYSCPARSRANLFFLV